MRPSPPFFNPVAGKGLACGDTLDDDIKHAAAVDRLQRSREGKGKCGRAPRRCMVLFKWTPYLLDLLSAALEVRAMRSARQCPPQSQLSTLSSLPA